MGFRLQSPQTNNAGCIRTIWHFSPTVQNVAPAGAMQRTVNLMANPQLEDGRTEIANEIVDALAKTHFSPGESKVLWVIFRKTYGYHKIADRISYSQFEEATGLNRWHIYPIVQRLKTRSIINVTGDGYSLFYSFQKDYEKWKSLPKSVTNHKTEIITETSNESLPKSVTNNESLLKSVTNQTQTPEESLLKSVTNEKNKIITDSGEIITKTGNEIITDIGVHKSNKAYNKSNIVLPDWIDQELWMAFLELRKKLKKPLTSYGEKLLVTKLSRLKEEGNEPNKVIERTIEHSWRSFFSLNEIKTNGGNNGNGHKAIADW